MTKGVVSMLVGGSPFVPDSFSFHESVFDYAAEFSFITPLSMSVDEVELEFDTPCSFTIVGAELLDSARFQYVCYPTAYVKFLNALTPTLNILSDLKGVCESLGIPYASMHGTQSIKWTLPRMKGRMAMDALLWGACGINNGGCSTLHFGPYGKMMYSDLLCLASNDPVSTFSGDLASSKTSRGYINQVPGAVDFYFYNEDSVVQQERQEFGKGFGVGSIRAYVNSSDQQNYVINKARNQFWRSVVSNSTQIFESVNGVNLMAGTRTRWLDQSRAVESTKDLIITALDMRYNDGAIEYGLECSPLIKL